MIGIEGVLLAEQQQNKECWINVYQANQKQIFINFTSRLGSMLYEYCPYGFPIYRIHVRLK